MARRTRRQQLVAQKRLSIWVPFQIITPTALAANALTLAASSNAALLALTPYTIVRTRGVFTVWSDQTAAAEAPRGILGVIVVKNTAVLIGATAIPDPLNEGNEDFYVYQSFQMPTTRQQGGAGAFIETGITQYEIDSKAMRKVDDTEDQAFMVRNISETEGLLFTFVGRTLIKLH